MKSRKYNEEEMIDLEKEIGKHYDKLRKEKERLGIYTKNREPMSLGCEPFDAIEDDEYNNFLERISNKKENK